MQLWVTSAQVSMPLHDTIHAKVWEQPAGLWHHRIQQSLRNPMQWYLPLSLLELQHPDMVRPDANKPSLVGGDILVPLSLGSSYGSPI
ncbi:hypothetical protein RB2150_05963 [Rhodobacterales bacterium HTCC2150]|nr:hypothetical protein RB2150_05963 [Rhodobacterales bacterium HTCC2150] [Rhodobacteraceae bacterium HTCC2150]